MRFLNEDTLKKMSSVFAEELSKSPDYVKIIKDNFYIVNEGEEEQFINFFSKELASFADDLSSTDIIDYDLSLKITTYMAIDDYANLFYVVIEQWIYTYIKLDVSLTKDCDKLNRKLLIPLRALLDEAMIAILASFNTLGNSHVRITTSEGYNFLFDLDDDSEYCDYASDYYAMDINQLDEPKLIYDNGEEFVLNLRIDGVKDVSENFNLPVIISSGIGSKLNTKRDLNHSEAIDVVVENNDLKDKYDKLAAIYEIY